MATTEQPTLFVVRAGPLMVGGMVMVWRNREVMVGGQ